MRHLSVVRRLVTAAAIAALVSGGLVPVGAAALDPVVVATVTVGAQPWGVAITPDGREAWVGVSGTNPGQVAVVDLTTRTVTHTIALTSGNSGSAGIVITPDGSKAFVANYGSNTLSVIDATTYTPIADVAAGCINPLSLSMRNDGTGAYYACGAGAIRLIANATGYATSAVAASGGTGMTDVVVIPVDVDIAFSHVNQNTVSRPGAGGYVMPSSGPVGLTASADGQRVYAATNGGTLDTISFSPWQITSTLTVGGSLRAVALTPDQRQAWVTDNANDVVKVVDLESGQVVHTVAVGDGPQRIAISADGRTAVVTNNATNTVSIIDIPVPPASGPNVPAPILQQFALGASGDCTIDVPDSADLPGLDASMRGNGWGTSWAQWANDGLGGAVCTREVVYAANGTWQVR